MNFLKNLSFVVCFSMILMFFNNNILFPIKGIEILKKIKTRQGIKIKKIKKYIGNYKRKEPCNICYRFENYLNNDNLGCGQNKMNTLPCGHKICSTCFLKTLLEKFHTTHDKEKNFSLIKSNFSCPFCRTKIQIDFLIGFPNYTEILTALETAGDYAEKLYK